MSPEYAMYGHLSDRADVYSFGIVILEIVSGRRNNTCPQMKKAYILFIGYESASSLFILIFNFLVTWSPDA